MTTAPPIRVTPPGSALVWIYAISALGIAAWSFWSLRPGITNPVWPTMLTFTLAVGIWREATHAIELTAGNPDLFRGLPGWHFGIPRILGLASFGASLVALFLWIQSSAQKT